MMTRRTVVLSLSVSLLAPGYLGADGMGVSGYSGNPLTNGGQSCGSCHSGGIAPVVTLRGPQSVLTGSTSIYTLTISGGQRFFGGLDVSATAGSLAPLDPATTVRAGEVTHMLPMPADGTGSIAFSFQWTAPSVPGAATLHGAGLSSNGMGEDGDAGDIDSLAISVNAPLVANAPPSADPGGPYGGVVATPIRMDASASSDPDGAIVSYAWDFGDGSASSEVGPSHAYAAAGTYTVSLTVTDDEGATDTQQTVAEIVLPDPVPPVASAGGPYLATVGVPVVLDGSGSADPDGTIVFHDWDFGDGFTGFGERPEHSYAVAGSYVVTLTVTDDAGLTDVAATTVDVEEPAEDVPIEVRLFAPKVVLVKDGRERKVNLAAIVDLSGLSPGTRTEGLVVLFKDGEPVAERTFQIQLPDLPDEASGPVAAGCASRGHLRGLRVRARRLGDLTSTRRLVRLIAEVSSEDAPSVEWQVSATVLESRADSEVATTEVRSWSPKWRRASGSRWR